MARKTPEGKVKDKVDDLLKLAGCYYFMPVQTGYGKRTLDYLGCHRGRFFAVETKAPGETLRPLQAVIAQEMLAAGAEVFVVDGEESLAALAVWLEVVS